MLPAEGSVREAATDGPVSDAGGEPSDPPRESPTTESATPPSETGANEGRIDRNPSVTVERLDDAAATTNASAAADAAPPERQTTDDGQATAPGTDGSAEAADASGVGPGVASVVSETADDDETTDAATDADEGTAGAESTAETESTVDAAPAADEETTDAEAADEETDAAETDRPAPKSLREHVREVVRGGTGAVRFLDSDFKTTDEHDAAEAFDAIRDAETPPDTVVLDGTFDQRLADVSAQRGVGRAVATATGDFVKKPVSVRVLTADQLFEADE
jgi:hypothetical protein